MNISVHPATEIVSLDAERTQLRGLGKHLTVKASEGFIKDLLALCDGTRARAQILEALTARYAGVAVERLLDALFDCGVVLEADGLTFPDRYEAMADRRKRRGFSLAARLQKVANIGETRIAVIGSGVLPAAIRAELAAVGGAATCVDPKDGTVDLVVASSDTPAHDVFRALNRELVPLQRPVLYACLDDEIIRLGPFVIPPDTACFECFHHRMRSHIAHRQEFDAYRGEGFVPRGSVSGLMARWCASVVVAIVMNWIHGTLLTYGTGQILEIQAFQFSLERQRILKLPRCLVCGRAKPSEPAHPVYEHEF